MRILIGVDEAGYGPNLGPLVVAATAWGIEEGREVRDQRSGADARSVAPRSQAQRAGASSPPAGAVKTISRDDVDLYGLLGDRVTRALPAGRALSRKRRGDAAVCDTAEQRLAIADSKALYKPGGGFRALELGVLGAISLCNLRDAAKCTLVDLVAATDADPQGLRRSLPWHASDERVLPVDATTTEIAGALNCLGAACRDAGVRLLAVRARLVFPAEFNALVDEHGTKGAALSHATLALVRRVVDETAAGGAASITCDKHGGRNRYAALLQHHFPTSWIDVLAEARAASRYAWTHNGGPCTAKFRVGGEAELPAALASMTAKYLRELAMHEFNAWWSERIPGIKPTAGYPVDAKRFKREIATTQEQLGITDHDLWRNR